MERHVQIFSEISFISFFLSKRWKSRVVKRKVQMISLLKGYLFYLKKNEGYLFYLAALVLSCGTWDLRSSLCHAGSSVVTCGI